MVIHDEDTLNEALLLVDSGSVRFSDRYAYIIITNRNTLEVRSRVALERGDIAIVVPLGMESEMENLDAERVKVRKRRQREEQRAVSEYFREHPEHVEKVEQHLKRVRRAEGDDES